MSTNESTERVGDRAVELFNSGWNCSESVFIAISEEIGINDPPIHLLTTLGGGFGSKRTCGALTGAIVSISIKYGRKNTSTLAKALAYEQSNALYRSFLESFKTIECSELTQTAADDIEKKRNCSEYVRKAAELAITIIQK